MQPVMYVSVNVAVNFTGLIIKMRYILHSGFVISASDGDRHYINTSKLARLYGLSPNDANVVCVDDYMRGVRWRDGDIHLHPRMDGNYKLPK
jgi:hypothetical protein